MRIPIAAISSAILVAVAASLLASTSAAFSQQSGVTTNVGPDWPAKLAASKQRMFACLAHFPTPRDGVERDVETEIRRDIVSCGQDYLSAWQEGGLTREQSMAAAVVVASEALGCQYAHQTDDDMQNTPQGMRVVSCIAQRRVVLRP